METCFRENNDEIYEILSRFIAIFGRFMTEFQNFKGDLANKAFGEFRRGFPESII